MLLEFEFGIGYRFTTTILITVNLIIYLTYIKKVVKYIR